MKKRVPYKQNLLRPLRPRLSQITEGLKNFVTATPREAFVNTILNGMDPIPQKNLKWLPGEMKSYPKYEMGLKECGFVKYPPSGTDTRTRYVLNCTECGSFYEYKTKAGAMPPVIVVLKAARRAGWYVAEGRRALCQTHAVGTKIFKTIVMREEPVAPVVQPLKDENPMGKEMNGSVSIAQPDMKLVRKVMNLLDEHFDDKSLRYKALWSDEKISKDTGVHIIQVAKIRAEAYGEIAEDPVITKLRDDFAAHELSTEELAKEAKALSMRLENFIAMRKMGGR